VLGSAPHRFSRATTGEGRVRLVREYVVACLRVHHRSGLPVAHSVSGTKHGRTFREIDGRISITPALTSCRAPGLLMVRRLFLAMLLRKVSGERNTVPERIPRSVSGSRTRASSGRYAWGAAETTWSRAISATGAGALSFHEDFPPLEVSQFEYPLSDTPQLVQCGSTLAGRPVGPGRQHAAAIGCTARPRAGAI
jgi:hypothetical protein